MINNNEDISEEYIQTVVIERVIKYIRLNDIIKEKQSEHRKEMKKIKDTKNDTYSNDFINMKQSEHKTETIPLKNARKELEQFLINFLDKVNEEYIQIGSSMLTKKTLTHVRTGMRKYLKYTKCAIRNDIK